MNAVTTINTTVKTCNVCGTPKPLDAFSARRASVDGRHYTCRTCDATRRKSNYRARWSEEREVRRQWAARNRERALEIVREWNARNPERKAAIDRAWRATNSQRLNEAKRGYRRARRGAQRAYFAAYELMRKQRVPLWADLAAIRDIYETAAWLRDHGIEAEVDHVIPLRGETVSGLHVHNNLQLLLKPENRAKSNKLLDLS